MCKILVEIMKKTPCAFWCGERDKVLHLPQALTSWLRISSTSSLMSLNVSFSSSTGAVGVAGVGVGPGAGACAGATSGVVTTAPAFAASSLGGCDSAGEGDSVRCLLVSGSSLVLSSSAGPEYFLSSKGPGRFLSSEGPRFLSSEGPLFLSSDKPRFLSSTRPSAGTYT